ncbi:hypothetical protein F0562_009348 [Nyssa sinensis]|uniref:Uncharacterized protein n=1 Tax=Nyssa sinensis TaxID=561372 RepID=A0A5J4ZVX6_9ASTE|nr:hypothetical protein F0562_009348 [Nyssa sinensis]
MYSYTPTYYTSLHDSITSICKTILPFSFKKRRLPAIAAAEQRLSKQQSDNLKWQQDSFHQILNLMGLCKEGILPEAEVSAFRIHLLDTLIASPPDHEHPPIIRDKLIFLQELLYAKCISEDEYHSSKRPLLQRLAVQGAEIEARNVIVGAPKQSSDEEWSVINLKDEQCLLSKENFNSKNKSKNGSALKQIKGAASAFNFVSSHKPGKVKEDKDVIDSGAEHFGPNGWKIGSSVSVKNELGVSKENPFWDSHTRERESETKSILMSESLPPESMKVQKQSGGDKVKKKPFRTLFQREQREGHGDGDRCTDSEERASKSGKKQWGFDGFKKWKRSDSEDETAPLPLSERSDSAAYLGSCPIVSSPIGEGPDTQQIKKKLHSNGSPTDFFIDKVLGEKIKKELSRIQTELSATNPNLQFSNDQIDAISTRLPVDRADLKKFFPKSWCDQYGDVVLDVVKKEFKDHVGEMGSLKNAAREKQNNSKRWATFDDDYDDENCHPNLFAREDHSFPMKQPKFTSSKDAHLGTRSSSSTNKCFKNNPFFPDYDDQSDYNGNKSRPESAFFQDQNPFWTPRHGSSMLG